MPVVLCTLYYILYTEVFLRVGTYKVGTLIS